MVQTSPVSRDEARTTQTTPLRTSTSHALSDASKMVPGYRQMSTEWDGWCTKGSNRLRAQKTKQLDTLSYACMYQVCQLLITLQFCSAKKHRQRWPSAPATLVFIQGAICGLIETEDRKAVSFFFLYDKSGIDSKQRARVGIYTCQHIDVASTAPAGRECEA